MTSSFTIEVTHFGVGHYRTWSVWLWICGLSIRQWSTEILNPTYSTPDLYHLDSHPMMSFLEKVWMQVSMPNEFVVIWASFSYLSDSIELWLYGMSSTPLGCHLSSSSCHGCPHMEVPIWMVVSLQYWWSGWCTLPRSVKAYLPIWVIWCLDLVDWGWLLGLLVGVARWCDWLWLGLGIRIIEAAFS